MYLSCAAICLPYSQPKREDDCNGEEKSTDGPDTLAGTGKNDQLLGLGGDDTLDGKSGIDKLFGGEDDDRLKGGGGNDELYGEDDNDNIIGGGGNDIVDGGTGNDTLQGALGNDKLYGGLGVDTLSGGAGSDSFYFSGVDTGDFLDDLADTITDFNIGEGDKIYLEGITMFDGDEDKPDEGHYGVWFSKVEESWIVTYKAGGKYHDIITGDVDPTGFVLSY